MTCQLWWDSGLKRCFYDLHFHTRFALYLSRACTMMHSLSIIGCIQHILHVLCCLNTSPARTQLCELLLLGASRSSSSTKHADAGSPALCGNLLGSSGRPSAGCLHSRQHPDSCISSSSQSTSFSLRLYGGAQFSQSYVHWVHMVQFYQQSVSPRAPHNHFATRAIRRCSIWYLGALTLFPGHREAVGVGCTLRDYDFNVLSAFTSQCLRFLPTCGDAAVRHDGLSTHSS